jgi:hypothetical protein
METRKVIIEVEVPTMFSESDVRDVFRTLGLKVTSLWDASVQPDAAKATEEFIKALNEIGYK